MDGPSEEGVERVVGDEDAVEELSDAGEQQEELEGVAELELLWGCEGGGQRVEIGRAHV